MQSKTINLPTSSALAFLGAVKVDIECGLVIVELLLDLFAK